MVKSFIFRDMDYHGILWENDPNLELIKGFFEDSRVDLEAIC